MRVALTRGSRLRFHASSAHWTSALSADFRVWIAHFFAFQLFCICNLRGSGRTLLGQHLELRLIAKGQNVRADLAIGRYLSAVWTSRGRNDADERVSFLLRLSWLWRALETCAGRLLRVLQLWLRAMSADSNRCAMLCVNAPLFYFGFSTFHFLPDI